MGSWRVKPVTRGLILLLVGTPFAAVGIVGGLGDNDLQVRGIHTRAKLVKKYTSRVATGGQGHLHYKLRLTYAGPNGNEHEHVTAARDPHHFESLQVGDLIDLVYDP